MPRGRSDDSSSDPLPIGLAALLIAQNAECRSVAEWLSARLDLPQEEHLELGLRAALTDWRKLCEALQRARMEEALARAGQQAAECRAARVTATAKVRETTLACALLNRSPPLAVPGKQNDGSNRKPFWQRLGRRAQIGKS